MDIKLFKRILKEFENSSIHKLEVTEKDFTVKLEKKPDQVKVVQAMTKGLVEENVIDEEAPKDISNYQSVESPLVGTFYDSPSPDSSPFIKVNQRVNEGDVLCIVEAMKVMNEIRSPLSGIVKNIHVSNETMVEFGQVLIEIEAV